MSKFERKKKGGMPAVNTASLPDIDFMLLFFFMVTTVMRETDLFIKVQLPKATEVKKLEKIDYKSLNVQALRDYCITCGVIENGDKKNKKEMLKLLEDMEK